MFATLATVAIASAFAVQAAPVPSTQPQGWATGYLEPYETYHTRYLALDCQDQHNTTFFDQCCHPLLATESLTDRPAYCTPNATASESAASFAATATTTDTAAATEYAEATASVESVYSSLTSAEPTATVDTTVVYTSTATSAEATSTTLDSLASVLSAQNEYAQASTSTSVWVAPTSTYTPPAATTTAASSSGGSGQVMTGGYATYFYQGGNPGACGVVHSDSEYGIAIDTNGWWQNTGEVSPYCGKQIVITNTNNGKTVTATVWDACPSCVSDNSLDLSVGAFTAIASESDGMVPITWQWA